MAQQSSFDVTTGVDMQEVDNAINQAQKEIMSTFPEMLTAALNRFVCVMSRFVA